MTADLAEFLLARIAEDEDAARAATAGPWSVATEPYAEHPHVTSPEEWVLSGDGEFAASLWLAAKPEDLAHITRWDPAHVLAECEAKRRIVEAESGAFTLRDEAGDIEVQTWSDDGHFVSVNGERMPVAEFEAVFTEPAPPSKTLKLLALPYADHPDYREAWRP